MAKKSETPEVFDENQELQNTENPTVDSDPTPITTMSLDEEGGSVTPTDPSESGEEHVDPPKTDEEPKQDEEKPETPKGVEEVAKECSKVVAKFFKFHQDLISYVNEPENRKFTIIIKYSYAREPEINKVASFFKTTIYDSSVVFDEALKVTCVNCNDTTMKFITVTAKDYDDTMKAIVDGSSDIAKSIASRLSIVPKDYYISTDLTSLTDSITTFVKNMNGGKDGSFITSKYSYFGLETKLAGKNLMFTIDTALLDKRCVELNNKGVTECDKAFIAFNPQIKKFLAFIEKFGMNALKDIDAMLKDAKSPISLQRKSGKTLIFIYDLTKTSESDEDLVDSSKDEE